MESKRKRGRERLKKSQPKISASWSTWSKFWSKLRLTCDFCLREDAVRCFVACNSSDCFVAFHHINCPAARCSQSLNQSDGSDIKTQPFPLPLIPPSFDMSSHPLSEWYCDPESNYTQCFYRHFRDPCSKDKKHLSKFRLWQKYLSKCHSKQRKNKNKITYLTLGDTILTNEEVLSDSDCTEPKQKRRRKQKQKKKKKKGKRESKEECNKMAECPSCYTIVPIGSINKHLDTCLDDSESMEEIIDDESEEIEMIELSDGYDTEEIELTAEREQVEEVDTETKRETPRNACSIQPQKQKTNKKKKQEKEKASTKLEEKQNENKDKKEKGRKQKIKYEKKAKLADATGDTDNTHSIHDQHSHDDKREKRNGKETEQLIETDEARIYNDIARYYIRYSFRSPVKILFPFNSTSNTDSNNLSELYEILTEQIILFEEPQKVETKGKKKYLEWKVPTRDWVETNLFELGKQQSKNKKRVLNYASLNLYKSMIGRSDSDLSCEDVDSAMRILYSFAHLNYEIPFYIIHSIMNRMISDATPAHVAWNLLEGIRNIQTIYVDVWIPSPSDWPIVLSLIVFIVEIICGVWVDYQMRMKNREGIIKKEKGVTKMNETKQGEDEEHRRTTGEFLFKEDENEHERNKSKFKSADLPNKIYSKIRRVMCVLEFVFETIDLDMQTRLPNERGILMKHFISSDPDDENSVLQDLKTLYQMLERPLKLLSVENFPRHMFSHKVANDIFELCIKIQNLLVMVDPQCQSKPDEEE